MVDVVGIRFRKAGKMYYFDPAGINLEVNDSVVVKTARGTEIGHVVCASRQIEVNETDKQIGRAHV